MGWDSAQGVPRQRPAGKRSITNGIEMQMLGTQRCDSESHQFKTRNFIDYTPEIISRLLDVMLASFMLA